jgi:hypothetical protein
LAREFDQLGMKEKAMTQYQEILKIDSTSDEARIELQRLKNSK